MNVWTYSGRVGADAELRTTASGEQVLSFRVANDVGFGDRKTTQWVDNSYWGKRAAAVAKYVRKGDLITVSGELQLVEFTKRDGTPGSKLAVRVNDLDLAVKSEGGATSADPSDKYVKGGGGHDYNAPLKGGAGGRNGGKPAFDQDLDDSIPFLHP
jgi:single-strand DNA-binding protein